MRSRWSGFTLVELLVVISIIGLLAGLSVPALQRSMASADQAVCTANLKGLGQALNTYVGEGGTFPAVEITIGRGSGAIRQNWTDILRDAGLATTNSPFSVNKGKNGFWYCPAALKSQTPIGRNATTYGYNGSIAGIPVARIAKPSQTALILDGAWDSGNGYAEAIPPSRMPRPVHPPTKESNSPTASINICFVDGHVEMRKSVALPTQTNDIFWNGQE